MIRRAAPFMLALAACTTQHDVVTSGTARFPAYPGDLLSAFQKTCSEPSQRFVKPQGGIYECREFLAPEPTADLILRYGGTLDALPQLVVRFDVRPDGAGYVVANEVYVDVPRHDGGNVHVTQRDRGYESRLAELYRRSGGSPI